MDTDKPLALVHFNHELVAGQVSWSAPGAGPKRNYGDMLVCASLLRQVKPEETVRVKFGDELSTPVGGALVRGSTYLNRRFDYDAAIRTIESIDAPIAMVGLGAQAPDEDPAFLDDIPAARAFVQLLSERSASISVRGDFTAAVLERLGATNLRITGCPSMFYSLTAPKVTVSPTLRGKGRRLGVSLHTGLRSGLFCRNPSAALRKQGRAISFALRSSASVSVFEQGVPLEYAVANQELPLDERLEAARMVLERFPKDRLEPIDLVHHMVGVHSVEDWLDRAGELDAMLGFRFHGNMVALTQGVPCYYYVYDSRIAEFCRLYRLPYLDVEADWRNPVTEILAHDWDAATHAIGRCLQELAAFYAENGVQHALTSAA